MDRHCPVRPHCAWVILAVTCLTVVMTAGVTAVPAVLIHLLEVAFDGSGRDVLAVSINVFLYGLAGPLRRAGHAACRPAARDAGQPLAHRHRCCRPDAGPDLAPPLSPLGRGGRCRDGEYRSSCSAPPWSIAGCPRSGVWRLGPGRRERHGRLVFPLLATIVAALGWQAVGWVVRASSWSCCRSSHSLMRDAPASMGLSPYGAARDPTSGSPRPASPPEEPLVSLGAALRHGDFWRLWLTSRSAGRRPTG